MNGSIFDTLHNRLCSDRLRGHVRPYFALTAAPTRQSPHALVPLLQKGHRQ